MASAGSRQRDPVAAREGTSRASRLLGWGFVRLLGGKVSEEMAGMMSTLGRVVFGAATLVWLAGCQDAASDEVLVAQRAQPLLLDPDFEGDGTLPAHDYTLFEADPVRPVVALTKSNLVLVANTPNDTLDLLLPGHGAGAEPLEVCASVHVGLRPVAAAVVSEGKKKATVWIVNHLSDSVSIVEIKIPSCKGEVVRTIHVGDEPRDIVVAQGTSGEKKVFVTTAHRGQHHPLDSARSGSDLVTPPVGKQAPGLADVFVLDAEDPTATPEVINLFTDVPRALAVGNGVVYAAGFHTGNRTVALPADTAARRGVMSLFPLLAIDDSGYPIEAGGQLELLPGVAGVVPISGGMAAVSGVGRCMPDPREAFGDLFDVGVCVKTDDQHRVQSVHVVQPGVVDPECQCTSGDGTPQPTTSVIVQFKDNMVDCGPAFTTFPDGTSGCWLDAPLAGVENPAHHADSQAPPMAFNEDVRLSLPDQDVFAIDVDSLQVTRSYSGVGTILFGMAVQPATGNLLVLGTEAKNLTRFEGAGDSSSTTVRGHLHESRISLLTPAGGVQPVHLNTHIDYGTCCEENPSENEKSLAFPTAGVLSPDGGRLFFTLLGSDKVASLDVSALGPGFDHDAARASGALTDLYVGEDVMDPSGPVGLALSGNGSRLLVKTHFSNEVLVIDATTGALDGRVSLATPEPASITDGRHVLYNARLTSTHGDSACASCHVFGNFDSLSWDLGDPDGATVRNPGPFAIAPEHNHVGEIAFNPAFQAQTPDFRSNKGPMSTQTLRGLANHGAQHWRGDRTRNFQDAPGEQPNFGSLNEDNSFNEFDVAIAGLNGRDDILDPAVFQAFTNFSLQLTLPPNPVRALDDSLTPDQAAGRATFFGCQSQTDDQFDARECQGMSGQLVADLDAETHACACAKNPFVRVLDATAVVAPFVQVVQGLLANPAFRAQFLAIAADTTGLPPEAVPEVTALAAQLAVAVEALIVVDLTPQAGMFTLPAAVAVTGAIAPLLGVLEYSNAYGTPVAANLIGFLLSAVPPEYQGPGSPFESPEAFVAALPQTIGLSNLTIRARQDELAAGTSNFRNLLGGCDVGTPRSCDLRLTDTLQTCNGCHSLNPAGNADFDVYRPGFFGSSGSYSFENESQVFKVPHLRNLYTKTGMFGTAPTAFVLPESILGPKAGGFFAPGSAYQGPQVRGSGFLHDGSIDTVHRFFGATVFAARPEDGFDPGNPGAFEAVLPVEATRGMCVSLFRNAPLGQLPPLDPSLAQALSFCSASSGLPDSCFLDPAAPDCQAALAFIADQLGDPNFPAVFESQIRFACFQLGSTLEGGSADGVCYPHGQTERSQMEAFMMAFDTNLKPIVGQQVTLLSSPSAADLEMLGLLLSGAERGECDLVAFQKDTGFVVTGPNPEQPSASLLVRGSKKPIALSKLTKPGAAPITLTCYPPQPGRAEAFRAIQ